MVHEHLMLNRMIADKIQAALLGVVAGPQASCTWRSIQPWRLGALWSWHTLGAGPPRLIPPFITRDGSVFFLVIDPEVTHWDFALCGCCSLLVLW